MARSSLKTTRKLPEFPPPHGTPPVAVRSESDVPALKPGGLGFSNASQMQAALLASARIGYSTGPSGTALIDMIDAWGLTGELSERLVQARPGIPVAHSLARGDVDLGFQQLSELVGQPGVRILVGRPRC